ncbi:GNAT family N-acetyltransferase [Rhizobium sp. TRM95001]|nr:GNAT family N-acetyltransferase [Rhizobium halophilum]MCF6370045.1 GNAT family N-acetyltransferase [Rhizobium halophilum]
MLSVASTDSASEERVQPEMVIRRACEEDLPSLIAIFAEDAVGGHGDTTELEVFGDYLRAFKEIEASGREQLFVAELGGEVVGTFQIVFNRTLTGRGGLNMTLEAVQTRPDVRGQGIGAAMVGHAVREARLRGCRFVQLTSNAARIDAHRFYERLGFAKSHIGFKMKLR